MVEPGKSDNEEPKFTKGEKCLFYHIVITFVFILIVLSIYLAHLFVVYHNAYDAFRVSRRYMEEEGMVPLAEVGTSFVGVVYLSGSPVRVVCNALMLHQDWSLVPGHCAAARTNPDLAKLLPYWRVRYDVDGNDIDSEVKKSIPHPHFNRNNFQNNIGLLQHMFPVGRHTYAFSTTFDPTKDANDDSMEMVQRMWNYTEDDYGTWQREHNTKLKKLTREECSHIMSSVSELRSYEFCATVAENSPCFSHGALVSVQNEVVGFFSWGPRCGDTQSPLTLTAIAPFHDWLQRIISI